MTTQDRVSRLESLLERVRRNSAKPRATASAQAPVAAPVGRPAVSPEPKPLSRPWAAAPPAPVVAAAPAPVASAPPAPVASAPPISEPVTLPPVPPPVPEPPSEPPSVAAPVWSAEHPSAVQERPSSVVPEELSDDDLLDVTTLPPAPTSAERKPESEPPPELTVSESPADFEDEQAPASSRRSKVAETLDEALASAAQLDQEEEREVPVKTPPPESGPQEAAAPLPPGLLAPGIPDVDALEADMLGPPSMGPTAEQLGETIELDAPLGPELEIDVAMTVRVAEPEAPPEELEVTLPRAPLPSGTYDVSATSPPVAVEVTGGAEVSRPPVDAPPEPFVPTVPAAHSPPHEAAPERTMRAQHGATDVARVVLAPSSPSRNFVELLDISLGL